MACGVNRRPLGNSVFKSEGVLPAEGESVVGAESETIAVLPERDAEFGGDTVVAEKSIRDDKVHSGQRFDTLSSVVFAECGRDSPVAADDLCDIALSSVQLIFPAVRKTGGNRSPVNDAVCEPRIQVKFVPKTVAVVIFPGAADSGCLNSG